MGELLNLQAEKVRFEVEEQRENQWGTLIALIQERVSKQLKARDEEIQILGKINWVLQQRVECLCVESQRWRDLARTNEAAANSLRTDLERVLAHAGEERRLGMSEAADVGGESSCCCHADIFVFVGCVDPPWLELALSVILLPMLLFMLTCHETKSLLI